MTRVNVLTAGFNSANGSAFLYPLVRHKHRLREAGIDINLLLKESPATADCEVLFVDSKYFRHLNAANRPALVEKLDAWSNRTTVYWFDTTDSTGTLQSYVLDGVSRYYKAQLLTDRTIYQEPLYCDRIVSDFYHRTFGVNDPSPGNVGPPVREDQLHKLSISWNTSLADYSRWGWLFARFYRMTGFRSFLRAPQHWVPPSVMRPHALFGRFGVGHRSPVVRYQRERLRELLGPSVSTQKIGRGAFLKELGDSFASVSPFGWGEITLRDFEVFINGCVMIKPSMTHLDTWPPLYLPGKTYVPFQWDFSDLESVTEWVLTHRKEAEQIAFDGQRNYKAFVADPWGAEQFVLRVHEMVGSL